MHNWPQGSDNYDNSCLLIVACMPQMCKLVIDIIGLMFFFSVFHFPLLFFVPVWNFHTHISCLLQPYLTIFIYSICQWHSLKLFSHWCIRIWHMHYNWSKSICWVTSDSSTYKKIFLTSSAFPSSSFYFYIPALLLLFILLTH